MALEFNVFIQVKAVAESSRLVRRGRLLACWPILAMSIAAILGSAVSAVAETKNAGANAATIKAFAALPDWTGIWQNSGALFDHSLGEGAHISTTMARDNPPYKPDWEARYTKFLEEVVWKRKFLDPLTDCFPAGFPRLAAIQYTMGGMQFVLRPEQTWIIYERNPVRLIFTDGRGHIDPDEDSPTWEGHSIGHWEGATLVVDTVSIKGGVPIDRSGLILSDKAHITERIHKVDAETMRDELTIEDSKALARPWTVVEDYKKVPGKYPNFANIACRENQRNPIVNGQNAVLLPGDPGYMGDQAYPPDIAKFAIPSAWAASKEQGK